MQYVAHAVSNRKKVVKFHLDELKSERYWWRNTLIGSVCRAIPRFQGIERFAMSRWKKLGLKSVYMVKQNIFLFNFESEESKNRILEEGP